MLKILASDRHYSESIRWGQTPRKAKFLQEVESRGTRQRSYVYYFSTNVLLGLQPVKGLDMESKSKHFLFHEVENWQVRPMPIQLRMA